MNVSSKPTVNEQPPVHHAGWMVGGQGDTFPLGPSSTSNHGLLAELLSFVTYFNNKGCVTHYMALPFTLKSILRQKKKELWKLKYFTRQKYNLQKIL
jgi:hypothetical protein